MTFNEIEQSIGNPTKYSKTYFTIIHSAKLKFRVKHKRNHDDYQYFEAHHILPKSLFPQYKSFRVCPWNKVLLTPREHFICHQLILKHYQYLKYTLGEMKMSRALFKMNLDKKYDSKSYERMRLNMSCSVETKEKLRKMYLGKSLEEIHGDDKAKIIRDKIKKNSRIPKEPWSLERRIKYKTGEIKNSAAIKINIYNNLNELVCETFGNFKEVCDANNYPFASLIHSYKNDGKPILKTKQSIASLKNMDFLKFSGWYAIKIS